MPSRRRNAPSVPACLHRSASASNRRFSLPENLRRLAIATTSGSRRAASGETVSPVALRAPSATASPEEPDNPFKEDLNNEVMCMSYLYSKLPEAGVPLLIGTGGNELRDWRIWSDLAAVLIKRARKLYLQDDIGLDPVSYTHLTLPTNREV